MNSWCANNRKQYLTAVRTPSFLLIMKKSTSYKEMLRDRCPEVVDLALKWCQTKTKWIDHVYSNFIGIYTSVDERYEATRIVLGIQKKDRNFKFEKTIHWDDLSDEEKAHWTYVKDWVNWFQTNHLDMQQYYKSYGREALRTQYLSALDEDTQQELADYLIESFD